MAREALKKSGIKAEELSVVLNASVCRDYLEPATAGIIANELGVSAEAQIFDVSNACLGFATAMRVLANMIESGQAENGLIVACETASEVVENIIKMLLEKPSEELLLTFLPTLTLGSGAVAMVMTASAQNTSGLCVCGNSSFNDCRQSNLCRWEPDTGFPSTRPHALRTDGKRLLDMAVPLIKKTWLNLHNLLGFRQSDFDAIFIHQAGVMHSNVVYNALGFDVNKDFSIFKYLGNTGSVALPLVFSIGMEKGVFCPGMRAFLLGVGSGLVCTMYALEWKKRADEK